MHAELFGSHNWYILPTGEVFGTIEYLIEMALGRTQLTWTFLLAIFTILIVVDIICE